MFESGSPSSRIAIVSESFTDADNTILDRMLHAAQIPRAGCYLTALFDCPTHNPLRKGRADHGKILSASNEVLWTATKGFTPAGNEASKGCLERLRATSANVICALGNPALHRCVDVRALSKWRGSILSGHRGLDGLAQCDQRRKVVATYAPWQVRQFEGEYELRWIVAKDLKRVREESKTAQIALTQRALQIDPTFAQTISYLRRCLDADCIDTDIELLNGSVDCFSLALSASDAISIPLITEDFANRWTPEEEAEIWSLYSQIISSPRITKVNQNIAFDLSILLQLNNLVPSGPIADCMIAFSVMNPFLKKDLGLISSLYTREPYYKDQGELHDSHTIEDFGRRWRYNALDAAVALESWLQLDQELGQYRRTYDMTMALIPSLVWMMVRGIRVNTTALTETKEAAKIQLAAIVRQMESAFGHPIITEAPKKAAEKRAITASGAINIHSPAQLCKYFYEEKGLRPYTSKSGGVSVDDLALSRIIRRDGLQEAWLLQEYRELYTLASRYLDVSFDRDSRVRSSWNPRGTVFGRLSSSKTIFNGGLNLQNLPSGFRGFMEADDAAA